MAVQQGVSANRRQADLQISRGSLARQELFQQQSLLCRPFCRLAFEEGGDLIGETENKTWLESNDRRAAFDIGHERGECPLCLAPGFPDLADREESAAAAQRSPATWRRGEMNCVAGRGEHRDRSIDVLSFKVAIERVGEKDHSAPFGAL